MQWKYLGGDRYGSHDRIRVKGVTNHLQILEVELHPFLLKMIHVPDILVHFTIIHQFIINDKFKYIKCIDYSPFHCDIGVMCNYEVTHSTY